MRNKLDTNAPRLPAEWAIPQIFRDRLGDRAGRQRSMSHEGHLLLLLHLVPKDDGRSRTARLIWRDPNGKWCSTTGESGTECLEMHLQEYEEVLVELDQQEQKAKSSQDYFALLSTLTPVSRASRNMATVLQSARENVPEDRDLINFRDLAYQIDRNSELMEADARNGLEVAAIRNAEEQSEASMAMSRSAHRLNILAAIFFPVATLASVFGTNFAHGLEGYKTPIPFLVMVGVGLASGIILALSLKSRR